MSNPGIGQHFLAIGQAFTDLAGVAGQNDAQGFAANLLAPQLQQIHATMQQMQASQQQMHSRVQQMHSRVQQMQASQQQMQSTVQQIQQELPPLRKAVQCLQAQHRNYSLRKSNGSTSGPIVALYKESDGGEHPVGSLPPPQLMFPGTRAAIGALSHSRLDALGAFYGEAFAAGEVLADRRDVFMRFICVVP